MKCFARYGKNVFLIILVLCSKINFGQGKIVSLFITDITGKPINLTTTYNITGNPYFPDNYATSVLYLKGGGKIENIKTKIYLPDYSVLYSLNDTADMVAVSVIEKITFSSLLTTDLDKIEFQLFPSPGNLKVQKYYQVIDTGNIKLLKLYTSDFTDTKEFGSASVTRTYEKRTDMYAYSPVLGVSKITGSDKLLSGVFADKQKEMADFINKNKINFKREKDLKKTFFYYNSL